ETAVPDDDAGDAVPAGHRAPRVPEHLAVVVRVQVDESGCDDLPRRVDDLLGVARVDAADLCDPASCDRDVGLEARRPQTVDDGPALDDEVVGRHAAPRDSKTEIGVNSSSSSGQ